MQSDCVVFTGAKNKDGYGKLGINGKTKLAHRHAWESTHGNIPTNMCVLHKCDNPACINLDHLFIGSKKDNMVDMANKHRHQFGEKSSRSKLTLDQVNFILSSDIPASTLGKQFGVSKRCINLIRSKQRWTFLHKELIPCSQ